MKNKLSLIALLFLVFAGYAQESYTLSKESILKINGSSTIHDWTVMANAMKGSLEMNAGALQKMLFQVEVVQIKSERGAAMDKKMHAALKMEEHPEVSFKFQEIKKDSGSQNSFQIVGVLNIAGIEKEVDIASEFQGVGGNYVFKGKKEIKLQDYDMVPPTAMFGQIIVGDNVTIDFNLIFTKG
ncbi:YceI family protein [Arenibacter sp. TNZ]|jgi:polyisoprenoid-binding protein YceI|uniref:YceI family protein n=1 Tax=Arenibacter TaxID=178469 RepID=UPI000CD3F206|nr:MULTISPECIES: YceI family protein [Arenibacter]MCM4172265.1 YceI family protein [Arenibacter sp. TNZ]